MAKKIYYYICIWAVCLLAACSAGDDATSFPSQADAENRVGVTLQLSALSSQTSQSSRSSLTRAAWETDTEALPGENDKKLVCGGGTEWNDREDYHFRFEIWCY